MTSLVTDYAVSNPVTVDEPPEIAAFSSRAQEA